MRALVVFAHPVETSFHAALHRAVVTALSAGGHEVDDCDLYAEGFDPVMGREERIRYNDPAENRAPMQAYIDRLLAARMLVLCFPVWSFGPPAILKGFLDRLLIPGVAFDIVEGKLVRKLAFRKLVAVTSYGQTRWMAWRNGDPPRMLVRHYLRRVTSPTEGVLFLAHYDMNRATARTRARFLGKVEREIAPL